MIRQLSTLIASAPLVLAAAAQAPAVDTLYYVVRDGVTMTVQGHIIEIDYADDGTFSGTAAGSPFEGQYRLDGNQLCVTSSLSVSETCTSYPEGKRPGDEFEVVSPSLGPVRIRIRTPEDR